MARALLLQSKLRLDLSMLALVHNSTVPVLEIQFWPQGMRVGWGPAVEYDLAVVRDGQILGRHMYFTSNNALQEKI